MDWSSGCWQTLGDRLLKELQDASATQLLKDPRSKQHKKKNH